MPSTFILGIILTTGFIIGEIATRLKLPKVTGYIIAGILLNPDLFKIIPANFIDYTDIITNVSLAFITFSVGGTLLFSKLKNLGKTIGFITIFEAEFAFLVVVIGSLIVIPWLLPLDQAGWLTVFIPISLLFGLMASPTDPSATLAVVHEFKARGNVTSTIMGVAAFDDTFGILNYSIFIVVAEVLIHHQGFHIVASVLSPLLQITGAVVCGVVFGLIFNQVTRFIKGESEGVFIVILLGLLMVCFGLAKMFDFDDLLATMVMGIVVVNFNSNHQKIFRILERYTEQLVFVLFFTISGMQLKFDVLLHYSWLVLFFVIFRAIGKITGTYVGAVLSKAPPKVKKFTAGGLVPQGGIVIGLALMIKQNPVFGQFSDIFLSIIIGATVVHELIGPLLAEYSLRKAGELTE